MFLHVARQLTTTGVGSRRVVTDRRYTGVTMMQWKQLEIALLLGTVTAATGACRNDDNLTGPAASVEEQRAFIDGIVPHHQTASMMADEAIVKTVRQGLRTMAQTMKTDQNREIEQYKDIRQQILGSEDTPAAMMMQPIPAGPDFDRQWLMMMIDHHQGAIDMSTLAHGSNVRSTLDSLAHHTIEEQKKEQQDMRDSLRIWYGVTP